MTNAAARWNAWLAAFADHPGRSADDQLRAQRTAALCSLTIMVTPGFLGAMLANGFVELAMVSTFTFSGFIVPLLLLRRGVSPSVAGNLACTIGALQSLMSAWFTTGLQGPSAIPVLLSPIAGTLLVGPRAGWFWLAVAGATLATLAIVDDPAWIQRADELGPNSGAISMVIVLLMVGAVIQGSLGATVQLEMAHRRDLDLALQQLERRVDERTADLRREVDERRRAELAAQRATAAKSAFLANMSHELRTPLNAIVGYTEMVDEELDGRPELKGYLGRVIQAANHLKCLIQDILDVARVERAGVELEPVDVDVAALLGVAVDMTGGQIEAAGNRLELRAPPPGVSARADAARTQQIVLNLLTNANKFTERGVITVSCVARDGAVEIRVADTGVGIAETDQERVFERFVQLDDSTTRRQGGVGLGLAIAREVARRMGGDVTVRSTRGLGSTFTLSLPAAAARASETLVGAPPPA
jgi:signal transduction histidine kinase